MRPAAELLGADAALATRLAVSGHLVTGRYDGKNCRGAEKYARLASWLGRGPRRHRPNAPMLWAYGNSRGDLRLLQAADHGVDAGRLGRYGRLAATAIGRGHRRRPAGLTTAGRPSIVAGR